MVRTRIVLGVLAAGLLGAAAAYAESGDGDRHRARTEMAHPDFAAFHRTMCADRYAREVGRMAYLEARLELSDAQHPLFDAWKAAVLGTAKTGEDACVAHQPPDFEHPPSIVDREAHERDRLTTQLAALDAEKPSLDTLYASLSADQKKALDAPEDGGRMMMRDRHEGFGEDHPMGPHEAFEGPDEGGPHG